MKFSILICAVFSAAALSTSGAATTFVVGAQAVSNPALPNLPNVWPASGNESPAKAIDGLTGTKYLNFAKNNTGYIYTLSGGGSAVVTGINFSTGNDAPLRDPSSYILYGSNSATANTTAGTIYDVDTSFTVVSSGALALPDTRTTAFSLPSFANTTSYSTYLLVFPTVKGSSDSTVNSMQIGEARLQTAAGDLENAGIIAGGQAIPEPGSITLLGLLSAGLIARRRRK
ncbi:MAG: PEP-CTERM sorting domain-containing protein [Verrucomicrobiota bacterium]